MNLQAKLDNDLWNFVSPTYEVGNYAGSVVAGIQFLSDLIRRKSGLDSDGQALVGAAFGGSEPIVKVNNFRSGSEKDEQRGMEFLLRGIYTGLRNPRVHAPSEDKKEPADSLLIFLSWVIEKIESAKSAFDPEEVIRRITDQHFVPTVSYAQLIIDEIPPGIRLDLLLRLMQQADWPNLQNILLFSETLAPLLSAQEKALFFEALNDSLAAAQTEWEFIIGVNFSLAHWPELSALSKTRAEHQIIKQIGRASLSSKKRFQEFDLELCSRRIASNFLAKNDLRALLQGKLLSSRGEVSSFVVSYWLQTLADLMPEPDSVTLSCVRKALKESRSEVYFALNFIDEDSTPSKWKDALAEDRNNFEFDDDIPF